MEKLERLALGERTAGPSTALRSGRDDNSIVESSIFSLKLLRV
jgi:hypothetical protein